MPVPACFTPSQLESISQILADTNAGLTGSEIARLLQRARIEDVDPGNTKWKRLSLCDSRLRGGRCGLHYINPLETSLVDMAIPAVPRMLLSFALVAALLPSASSQRQDPLRVVNAVVKGRTCKTQTVLRRIDCEYRVSPDLQFEILAVGQDDATVTIYEVDFDGDYYISMGGIHKCVTIKEGMRSRARLGVTPEALAFVSLRNGQVYPDWPTCDRAA